MKSLFIFISLTYRNTGYGVSPSRSHYNVANVNSENNHTRTIVCFARSWLAPEFMTRQSSYSLPQDKEKTKASALENLVMIAI